jgi:hypothetical protein
MPNKNKNFVYFHNLITPSRLLDAIKVCFDVLHKTKSVMTSLCPIDGSIISGPVLVSSLISTFLDVAELFGDIWLPL